MIDQYNRYYQQNRRTLEQQIEQVAHLEVGTELDLVQFGDQKLQITYGTIQMDLPMDILEINDLADFFDGFDISGIEAPFEVDLKSKEFKSAMRNFQRMLRSGNLTIPTDDLAFVTTQRAHYMSELKDYFENADRDQQRRQLLMREHFSEDEESISKYIKSEATQSSQSLSPVQIREVYVPLQVPQASNFFNAPSTTQLAPFQSTSVSTAQLTLALLQAKKSVKQKVIQNNESNILTGQSNREWLEFFWRQERERYSNPLSSYTFTCIDGEKATVAPVAKKLFSGTTQKPRQHELLKNERPNYVTILSLVRDASSRLPKGFGTRADIMNLVKDSQYVNENLPDEKMSSIISGALDRLHQSTDPCVQYDQEKKIWIYLHHDRDGTYPEWQVNTPVKGITSKKRKQMSQSQISESQG